ncbi:unnamed protein product [Candidula unifasciata]|uniref:EF-hand domain-containing protein n=1 Tax=Candidula unifasciata TaxID=100452 RepID=A0A8S3YZ87_9EUPU|nr:unnamed protein product [Candidula unifasciata]
MAKQKSSDDQLLKLFQEFDKDKSGCLSRDEVEQILKLGNKNIKQSHVDEVFKFFDTDGGDQKITFKEFKEGLQKIAAFIQGIKDLFKSYDKDKSGTLDKNEMKKVLDECGHKFTDAEVNEIFKQADRNNDGKICIDEFMNCLT